MLPYGFQYISYFCLSVALEEIRQHGYVLTPNRYAGAETQQDDEQFEEKQFPWQYSMFGSMCMGSVLIQKL